MLLDATDPANTLAEDCDAVIQLKLNGSEPGAAVSATAVAENQSPAVLKRHERRARQGELDRLRRRAR
jgi:hypothetical protein